MRFTPLLDLIIVPATFAAASIALGLAFGSSSAIPNGYSNPRNGITQIRAKIRLSVNITWDPAGSNAFINAFGQILCAAEHFLSADGHGSGRY